MEGLLSLGSRVAGGELAGQLRTFINKSANSEEIDLPALRLFTARTVYFFQRELPMPKPINVQGEG